MDWVVILFTSNNPIMISMGTHVPFKNLITKEKLSTLPWDIHKSKLVDIIAIDATLGKTCWSMIFFTMVGNVFSTKEN
jgi:hypothetical protein